MEDKICTKCGEKKPISRFYKNGKDKNGNIKYYPSCKSCKDAVVKPYKEKNPELIRQIDIKNNDRRREAGEYIRNSRKRYKKNPAYFHEKRAKRRADKLQRTPPWARTGEIREQIKEIYNNRPPGHHVDHIHPLRGKTFSGLHVPWNLQYLPSNENLRKSNKLK